ncbi:MAG: polysaccharide biosynthesis tyrosine autokinase [Actinomycetota bacterium]
MLPVGSGSAELAYFGPGFVNLDTESGILKSVTVAKLVNDKLKLNSSPESLLKGLTVQVEANTEILGIQYTGDDPKQAQRLAQGFAESYVEYRRNRALDVITGEKTQLIAAISNTRKQIAGLGKRAVRASPAKQAQLSAQVNVYQAKLTALQQQLLDLQPSPEETRGGEIVQPAVVPTAPSGPNHAQAVVLSLVVGLALGVGVVFLRERMDKRLRGGQELEEQLGAPVLAVVPHFGGLKRKQRPQLVALEEPQSGAAEAYRTLRTNLKYVGRGWDVGLLSVTSPLPGEGKTTTVANFAVAMAQTGKRVIAVSCDLRRPALHRFFGAENEIGVTTLLTGKARLVDVIQQTPMSNLRLLATGPVLGNPAELVESEEMHDLLRDLRTVADFVIVDTPPLLAVADALPLASQSDGVLIVAEATSTSRDALARVKQQLDQVQATVVGAVFNNFDPSRTRYDGSYYGHYRYRYRYTEDGEKQRVKDGERRSEKPQDAPLQALEDPKGR